MKMKKSFFAFAIISIFLSLSVISLASALNLTVEKAEKTSIIISELNDPAVFDFVIDNKGAADVVEIYSLVGVSFEPKGTFELKSGTTTLEVKAYPGETARKKAETYSFEYQIKGVGSDLFKDTLTIKIVKLEDVLEISPRDIVYGDGVAVMTVKNTQNLQLNDVSINFKSIFFEEEKTLSFKPLESKYVTFNVKKEELKDVSAGSYIVTADLKIKDKTARVEGAVNYLEKKNVDSEKKSEGWVIRTTNVKNTNKGNVNTFDRITITRNILTRLFTTSSVEPLNVERRGWVVEYIWERELKPGESWTVKATTNYTLPLILILLIIASAYMVYAYSRTSVVLNKRCSFVRTTGGQFALKVTLHLKARKSVESIEIFDRVPMAMKLYEKAGMPHKVDSHTNRLSWKVERLNAGEERVFSYIIYSTIRVVGRLELPPATAHFIKDGKSQYISSNRTFFMSEIHPRM